jgi:superfamily II DNA or RNA helicase
MNFNLTREQTAAIKVLLKHNTGILHAPTAFGKTITALAMLAKRRVNTLILVHSRHLLDQWRERLATFLPGIQIGIIGGGKNKPSGVVDVATYQSLINKKDNSVVGLVQDYGHVIVDECHHVSAVRYEMVMNEVRAKYVLGLTATPERQDGQQRIIFMITGPIRHHVKISHSEVFNQLVSIHQRYDPPPASLIDPNVRPKINEVYQWINENQERTAQIVADVIESVNQKQNPLVLTERREHALSIYRKLQDAGIQTVILQGALEAKLCSTRARPLAIGLSRFC